LVDSVVEVTGGSVPTVATNLAYPVADVLLLGMVVGSFAVSSWRPSRALLLVGAGLAAASIADSIYLYRTAAGTYEVGTLLDTLWPAAMLLLAAAAWARDASTRPAASRSPRVPAVATAAAAASLALLVYGSVAGLGWLALVFASAAIGLAIVRGARAVGELARTATLEERRRIARGLHDGLAQEVAFIGRNAALLDGDQGKRIQASIERARSELGGIVAALSEPPDLPLDRRLADAGREVGAHAGISVELHLAADVAVAPGQREEIVRVAREALVNAARHSGAASVRLELAHRDGGPVVSITDVGCGFDPAAVPRGQGFGLIGMRQRAQGLGATLNIHSSVGAGTRVELQL
ncbi:MAG TPA: ATP-binding protein, partial [Thermoleophilaceae bacterium]|nr:ATP-binding protein [Thermoleophilaceae bacterium]